jgi:excinuclease UvrABC nuclease subunit
MFSVDLPDFSDLESIPGKFLSGVYIFLDGKTGRILYCGQSGDIRKRVRQHCSDKRKTWATPETKVIAFVVPDESRGDDANGDYVDVGYENRLVLETLMILLYRPRHNRSIKLGLNSLGGLRELQFIRSR